MRNPGARRKATRNTVVLARGENLLRVVKGHRGSAERSNHCGARGQGNAVLDW